MINRTIILHGGSRPASELAELARRATDAQLGLAIKEQLDGVDPDAEDAEAARVFGDFFHLAARNDGRVVLDDDAREALRERGRTPAHMRKLELLIAHNANHQPLSNAQLRLQLEALGVQFDESRANTDRRVMLAAWADAQYRAATFNAPSVESQASSIQNLLNARQRPAHEPLVEEKPAASGAMQMKAALAEVHAENPGEERQHATKKPLLSEVIEQVVAAIVRQGKWKDGPGGTAEDAKRLVKQFVWMVGDFPVDQYGQHHLALFEREMMAMPRTVRVQTVWEKPYAEAKKNFPTLTPANTRQAATINKDLAYLSTFTDRMVTEGHWTEGQMKPLAFSHKVSAKRKSKARPPWQPAQIDEMLASPIYSGNGGSKRRLKPGKNLYQDAAYWVLLLAIYTGACQGELCGLLVEEVVSGCDTIPHLVIQDNDLRTLKRDARERAVPLHPRLIELGFVDYVEKIKREGASEVFPELWCNETKRGGDQYRAIVWDKLVNWLRARNVQIPSGIAGKEADFHSLRTMVLSLLDRADINQNIVKDIAGHARAGVTAGSYQDLVASGGLNDALNERLKVLMRLPDFAASVAKVKPIILPINLRSR